MGYFTTLPDAPTPDAAPAAPTTPAPNTGRFKTLPDADPATPASPDTSLLSKIGSAMTAPIATGSIGDTLRVAGNTFGLYDRAMAAAAGGGPEALQAERAKTAAATGRLTGIGPEIATTAGYLPFAALGVAPAITGALGGAGLVTSTLGNVAEGALGGALSSAGRGEDVTTGTERGAIGGAIATPIQGVGNWIGNKVATNIGRLTGGLDSPAEATAATAAAKIADYGDATNYEFTRRQFAQPYIDAKNSLTPGESIGLSPSMKNEFNRHIGEIRNGPSPNADTIDSYSRDIGSPQAVKSGPDRIFATRIQENLDNMMKTAPPTSGQPVGDALVQIEQARQSAQQAIMAKGLQGATRDLADQQASPGAWAQQQIQYYKPGTDQYKALTGIIKASGGGGPAGQMPSGYGMAHVGGDIAEMGLAAAGMPSAGLMAGAGVQLAKPVLGGIMKFFQRGQLMNQLNAAYPDLTGRQVAAFPHVGDVLRMLTESQTAGNPPQ